jgi:hypothetical protein
MNPSIGRIVHYKRTEGDVDPFPAIILVVDGPRLLLKVFMPHADHDMIVSTTSMASGPKDAKEGEWWWPERL